METIKYYKIIIRGIDSVTNKTVEAFDVYAASCYVIGAHGELRLWYKGVNFHTYNQNRWLDILEINDEEAEVLRQETAKHKKELIESFLSEDDDE